MNEKRTSDEHEHGEVSSISRQASAIRGQILQVATSLIGAPAKKYQYGLPDIGADPKGGFDCSGFVRYVMMTVGLDIPGFIDARGQVRTTRHADELWETFGIPVHNSLAIPGDLVFFSREGWRASHVGVVLTESSFIHSPGVDQATVTVTQIAEYVKGLPPLPRLIGGRRPIYNKNPIGYKTAPFPRLKEYRIRHYPLW